MYQYFKNLILFALALFAITTFSGCGGGGGGGGNNASPPPAPPPTSPPPPSARTDIEYAYFAVDGNQLAETAEHVTAVLVPDWGPWDDPAVRNYIGDRMIAQMQEADSRGVHKFIVSIGVFVFTATPNGVHERFRYKGTAELSAFKAKLDALGLTDKVIALYPVDEPELHDLNGTELGNAVAGIRAAWSGPKLAVIYGDSGNYPARSSYDWIGIDNYGAREGVLNMLPPLDPGQKHIIVPGGADPTDQDPEPFYAYANAHLEVAMIMPFVWFDGTEGGNRGIRSNGLAHAYCTVGQKVKNPLSPAPCP